MENANEQISNVIATLAKRADYCYTQHMIYGSEQMSIKGQALEEAVAVLADEFGLDLNKIWAPYAEKANQA
jgi:hypothetical protein